MCIQIKALIFKQLDGSMFCLETKCQNKDAINLELGHRFRIDENSTSMVPAIQLEDIKTKSNNAKTHLTQRRLPH